MRKHLLVGVFAICAMILTACANKQLEAAKVAVDTYNTEAAAFNEKIKPYNDAVAGVEAANEALDGEISDVQELINKGETPYDPETLTGLKDSLSSAVAAKVSVPEKLDEYEMIEIQEGMKKADLEALTQKVLADTDEIKEFAIPQNPEVPDYSETVAALQKAKQTYLDSVTSLQQVTAPSDAFVIERLQSIDTILAIDAVTEDHDPNGKLNKQGGYIGCIYFSDEQVDKSKLYIDPSKNKDDVIDVGTIGGGAVEIFANVEDAEKRDVYLGSFDGTILSNGSHYIVGTCVVRTSEELTGTQQKELTEQITQALIEVK